MPSEPAPLTSEGDFVVTMDEASDKLLWMFRAAVAQVAELTAENERLEELVATLRMSENK